MWHMGDGWGWWMVMGWLWMALFWGLIIWGVYAVVTRLGGGDKAGGREPNEPSALELLERRYARGELSDEEFEAMRARLARTPAGPVVSNGRTTGVPR